MPAQICKKCFPNFRQVDLKVEKGVESQLNNKNR